MSFDDAIKAAGPIPPQQEYDPRFLEASRAVASGRMEVDEAWAWLKDPLMPPMPHRKSLAERMRDERK